VNGLKRYVRFDDLVAVLPAARLRAVFWLAMVSSACTTGADSYLKDSDFSPETDRLPPRASAQTHDLSPGFAAVSCAFQSLVGVPLARHEPVIAIETKERTP